MHNIRIATRESLLALWQAHNVSSQINKLNITSNIVKMKTQGDIILDKPLSEIGGKALFMKELELAILAGKADIAVHSLKDIPYQLPKEFSIAAICKREDPRDAFVSNNFLTLHDLPAGAVVGTSSLRRGAQIQRYRPDIKIKNLRGNIQTRLRKLDDNEFDAIILAAAGLIRLDLKHRISDYIDIDICLPAVGQGVVAIEYLQKNHNHYSMLRPLNCTKTEHCILAERTFNETLKGGCHVAIAAYATWLSNDSIKLRAMVANQNGSVILKESCIGLAPQEIGERLAKIMIDKGALEILKL